jgi:uncharacterized protein
MFLSPWCRTCWLYPSLSAFHFNSFFLKESKPCGNILITPQAYITKKKKQAMPHPKFILKLTTDERFHFNLTARNGQVILTSQTYTTKAAALQGISSVQTNSPHDEMYSRYPSTNDQYYFNLKANNGQVIGTSEMYNSVDARDNGIESVRQNGQTRELEDQTLVDQEK